MKLVCSVFFVLRRHKIHKTILVQRARSFATSVVSTWNPHALQWKPDALGSGIGRIPTDPHSVVPPSCKLVYNPHKL
jgi:hypothetical protein